MAELADLGFFCPIEHSMAILEMDFERTFEAFFFQVKVS